jgi:iron complex outermembrane receptor protein
MNRRNPKDASFAQLHSQTRPARLARLARLAPLLALPWLAGSAAAQTPVIELDTVRATVGSRASAGVPVTTRAVQVITAEQLATAPGQTLADALAWALGVDLQPRSAAQADLALRGSSFEQVLVLVDGVRMSDAQTGHFDLDLAIPLAEVERIEVMRGPATALYGSNAVGGVVQVVTRRGGSRLQASISGGSFGTMTTALAAAAENDALAARIAAEYRRSDGHRPGTDDRGLQTRAALDARTGRRTLRADLALAARDFGARAFYTAVDAPYDEYEETRTATASLSWLAPADARLALEPRLSARRHEDDFLLRRDDPGFYRNRHTSWQFGGELTARYQASPLLDLALGAEAYRDDLESTSLGDREEDRAALFAEANLGRIGTATLGLGLRADWHSAFGDFIAPSIAGAVWPAERLRLRASLGRAFRAPTWTERYYRDPANIGDPDLDPERAWETELGADLALGAGIRVGVAGFLRSASGLIDWARPTGATPTDPWHTRNVSDARFRGLEVDAAATDPLGIRWQAALATLSLRAEDTGGLVSKYALRPLTRTASLAAERELGAGLSLALRGYHARRTGENAYLRTDLRLAYEHGGARFYLDLNNLGDERYLDVTGLEAPRRALFLGLSWGRIAR